MWHSEPSVTDWPSFTSWLRDDSAIGGKYARPYVPVTFQSDPTRRLNKALVSRHVLTLDADHAGPDYLDVVAGRLPWLALSHTTASHSADEPRWRTLVPLDRAATPAEAKALATHLVEQIGRERFDVQASTSPVHVAYAPAWPDVEYAEHDGPVLDVDGVLLLAPEVEWSAGEAEGAATLDEFLAEHAVTDLDALPTCHYGRAALDGTVADLDITEEGSGVHSAVYAAAARGVELVTAGCWSARDLDRLQDAAVSLRAEPRPHEFTEALVSALQRGAAPLTACDEHGTPAVVEPDEFDKAVEKELDRLRVRDLARQRFDAERREDRPIPLPVGLRDFLAQPDDEAAFRLDGLWPSGGRVVLAAAQKSGKTTTVGNLIRSLVDGDMFLDRFDVEPAERVIVLDNELSPRMVRSWLADQNIETVDAVDVLTMRGALSGFNVLDPATRSRWAAALGPADVLVFDCLRPALDALGLDENHDAGRMLEALDALTAEAGIGELLVVHHMGHGNERTRGDSRILDWPDAVWYLVRENPDDHGSQRFFRAYGRDVDQPEVGLLFNPFGRRLSVTGGSRREAKAEALRADVLAAVEGSPGSTQTAVEKLVTGKRDAIRAALRALTAEGAIRVELHGQSHRHFPAGEVVET